MWLNKKEWLFILFSLTLLISGGAYFYFLPAYNEHFIHNIGSPLDIWEVPAKSGNNALIIKVEGYANDDYALKLDYFFKNQNEKSPFKKMHSEVIRFPAGDIHGTLKRDFHGEPNNSKILITYIPEHYSSTSGIIKLKVGIF